MHARPRRRPTVTERIDRAVLGVPAERRNSVIFVTSLFGLTACAGLATLALGLSLGSAGVPQLWRDHCSSASPCPAWC